MIMFLIDKVGSASMLGMGDGDGVKFSSATDMSTLSGD